MWHVRVPLLVVLTLTFAIDVLPHGFGAASVWPGWSAFWEYWRTWLTHSGWRELVGVYVTFFVESSVLDAARATRVTSSNIGLLNEHLQGAERLFGIATIGIREWFEPNAFLYLAAIVQHQRTDAAFRTTSACCCCTARTTLDALKSPLLDAHYAQCFSAIHDRLSIPLSYLRPNEIRRVLATLDTADRSALASYRWFGRLLPWWLSWTARIAGQHDESLRSFLAITKQGQTTFFRFSKDDISLKLEQIANEGEINACNALVLRIEKTIFKPGTTDLRTEHKFSEYLSL